MKQVLQNLRSGETQVVDIPMPQAQPGTALVKTAASLVSAGTERMVVDFAGKSLLGKKKGDKVEIEAPAGKVKYHIEKIH